MKVTIEVNGQLGSVHDIAGAMSINGLLEIKRLPNYGRALEYESKEAAVSAMRAAFAELTEDGEAITDSISEDGTSLHYDAGTAKIMEG